MAKSYRANVVFFGQERDRSHPEHCRASVASTQGLGRCHYRNCLGSFWSEWGLWAITGCAQHHLGRETEAWRRNRRISAYAVSLFCARSRNLLSSARVSHNRGGFEELQSLPAKCL